MKAIDVPTPEELIQNLKVTDINMRRESGTSVKVS
jgi:post-segregation antitoxin (ccd killing protein)